ncbi:N-acetylmuramoyl-L-alanine amidase [Frigoriflavimonas asaccharolytica]|uniref:N-acetylmuramoyl-L-alanine amidase n=1 Tax=Frigoriflavimonas asaccharolytica TaxID=2735899 RepID=A0A8J8G9E3_9FLAO|nr:N-acetylmuramoyl-L-alanine amidase [Frigoriflavimonas asaccharolytica]NRS92367.1 N-acetylmuramoyl-L-alanine amidase [Frigoriflavimonas asaccharolytica]
MHKCLTIMGLSFLVFSCSAQKNSTNRNIETKPKPITTATEKIVEKKHEVVSYKGVEFFKNNIGDITKNDNTTSYGSIVTAEPKGFKVVKTYFPSLAQNFRQKYIILHYTAIDDDKSILALTQRGVSAHYLVNDKEDNQIYQLVDENKRAYHAGLSVWRNDKNLNDNSIGIEITNMGYTVDSIGKKVFAPFNENQLKKVFKLVKDIADRYQIPPTNILGHSDVAPTRKQDPGPMFPWKKLYEEEKIGMWYDDATMKNVMMKSLSTFDSMKDKNTFIFKVQSDLQNFGYDIVPTGSWNTENMRVVESFQYRFRPENYDGVLDLGTYSILQALLQKYPGK